MDIIEIIILLAITFGGSIIKFVTEKKKAQQENPEAAKTDEPSFKEILMKEFGSSFGENEDEGAEDEYFEQEADDFLPRAETTASHSQTEPAQNLTETSPIQTEPAEPPTKSKYFQPEKPASSSGLLSSLSTNLTSTLKIEDEISDSIEENDVCDPSIIDNLDDIDQWKKAVIYQEILSRKY